MKSFRTNLFWLVFYTILQNISLIRQRTGLRWEETRDRPDVAFLALPERKPARPGPELTATVLLRASSPSDSRTIPGYIFFIYFFFGHGNHWSALSASKKPVFRVHNRIGEGWTLYSLYRKVVNIHNLEVSKSTGNWLVKSFRKWTFRY